MEDKQKLEKMMNELNTYKSQAELIQQEIETLQGSLSELEVLSSTIESFQSNENMDSLVPLGAGSFVPAKIKKPSHIIMSVGASVAVNKKIEDAEEDVKSQREKLEKNLEKMISNLQQINDIIANLTPQAEELLRSAQGQ